MNKKVFNNCVTRYFVKEKSIYTMCVKIVLSLLYTGRMGDEDTAMIKRRQALRRPKIIIRKCKKLSSASKSEEDGKKVNGEFPTEKDGKGNSSNCLDVAKRKEPSFSRKTITITTVKKRKLPESVIDEDTVSLNDNDDTPTTIDEQKSDERDVKDKTSSVKFKGFKKRILARRQKSGINVQEKSDIQDSSQALEKPASRAKSIKVAKSKNKSTPVGKKGNDIVCDVNQGDSQTEYAQYLGLQPTMQFKCYRCGERGFPSMLALNMHQRGCGIDQRTNFIANLQQDTAAASSDPNILTNFRITRKVYLCSACGTYYENWNLFLHMREVHKKHICLYCLTMFGLADKLADHLKNIHAVQEAVFSSREEFQSTYNGSYYLICCICENLFSEGENYFNHRCEKRDPTAKCNLCGVKCGHYFTCPNSNSQRNVPASVNINHTSTTSKTQASAINKNKSDTSWMNKSKKGRPTSQPYYEDLYDISNAASFCHVALADETGEIEKSLPEDNVIDITDDIDETPRVATPLEEESLKSKGLKDAIASKKTDDGIQNLESDQEKSVSTEKSSEQTSYDIQEELHISGELQNKKAEEFEIEQAKELQQEKIVEESSHAIVENEESHIDLENNIDSSINDDSVFDSSKEINKLSCSPDHNIGETGVGLSEELSTENNNKEDVSSVGGEIVQPQEAKSDECHHNIKSNSESSDSDGEPNTQLSVSHDDSESSSDSSSEDEHTKINEKSIENAQGALSGESRDSMTSGQLDKMTKSIHDNFVGSVKETPNSTEETENLHETKSTESNEPSQDFHLDEDPATERSNENEEITHTGGLSDNEFNIPSPIVNDGITLASEDVPAMALTLDDKLEEASYQSVVKECVRTSCQNCVYCSHAIKIAVNGKQLALHLLAEHRYKPVKINETSQDVIKKLKTSLNELEPLFFNTDSYDSSDKSLNNTYDYTYECFQCHFVTKIHKELYVHKRKMHQKTVLLCVMCKANFYSYSELLCHMCPGIYVSEDINFRCCFCNLDMIPSAFRLMVHLRKTHHTCDICLEVAGDQQKLSTHMWKHKLNHLCYRCGIAYRNKPDITKHLFWKHGTESVLCKKCLQKKWPHVYHFCIPPTVFICEECNASFTKAVALKVHKRFHSGELPHVCSECDQRFVSKKLLKKHEESHSQPALATCKSDLDSKPCESADEQKLIKSVNEANNSAVNSNHTESTEKDKYSTSAESKSKKKKKRDKDSKPVLDVYDLPPLNLSSESDSSDEEGVTPVTSETLEEKQVSNISVQSETNNVHLEYNAPDSVDTPEENPVPIVDGVWDNFHSYKAELEKRESKDLTLPNIFPSTSSASVDMKVPEVEATPIDNIYFLLDHNYCSVPGKPKPSGNEGESDEEPSTSEPNAEKPPVPQGHSSSVDHAYATTNNSNLIDEAAAPALPLENPSTPPPPIKQVTHHETHSPSKKKQKTPKKKKHNANSSSSSASSSDSDTTGCEGEPCTCHTSSSSMSSSSSSDSDTSTSEDKRRETPRKEKKKERLKHKHCKEEPPPALTSPSPLKDEPLVDNPVEPLQLPIKESDLDTDESSTDEDFYDKYPQSLARQQLEKRNKLMLLASVAPVNNGTVSPPPVPPLPVEEDPPPPPTTGKRKVKTKRRIKSQQYKKSVNRSNNQVRTQPSTSLNLPAATSTPHLLLNSNNHSLSSKVASPLRTNFLNFQSDTTAGSGSENDARLSKRKRVRNKFYGYSSDEEDEKVHLKMKKVVHLQTSQSLSFQPPLTIQRSQVSSTIQMKSPVPSESSDEEPALKKENESKSSSSSSESDDMESPEHVAQKEQTEKSDNLYCYCQCPYDEVSEMIACDGEDCTIEWFHFECVGIMVPPKGKWYCPDCRKRRDLM